MPLAPEPGLPPGPAQQQATQQQATQQQATQPRQADWPGSAQRPVHRVQPPHPAQRATRRQQKQASLLTLALLL